MIQWIQEPTDTNTLRDFQQWKEKCDVKVIFFLLLQLSSRSYRVTNWAKISQQFVLAII